MKKNQLAMVVDDNQAFADMVSRMLMKLDFNTMVCADYESAIDAASRSRMSLLMADIFMPGMGGIEGIRQLREEFPETTIIAMSGGWGGMSAGNTVAAAKKIGADACLVKPFRVKDLETALHSLKTG